MSIIFTNIARQTTCRQYQYYQLFTRSYSYKTIGKTKNMKNLNIVFFLIALYLCIQFFVDRKIFSAKEASSKNNGVKWTKVRANTNRYEEKSIKKRFERSLEVVKKLPANTENFTEIELIEAFDRLAEYPMSDNALQHENFIALIEATRLILPKLSETQCVHILVQMSKAQVPIFDELSEFVAKNLIERVENSICNKTILKNDNDESFTIGDIVAIDLAIREYCCNNKNKISKLFDSLRRKTRAMFLYKVMNNEGNFSSQEMIQIMQYLSNSPSLSKFFDTDILFEKLIATDDSQFKKDDTITFMKTLGNLKQLNRCEMQLINKMVRVWCNESQTHQDIFQILETISLHWKSDVLPFQSENFHQQCTKIMIAEDSVQLTVNLLDYFTKIVSLMNKIRILIENVR